MASKTENPYTKTSIHTIKAETGKKMPVMFIIIIIYNKTNIQQEILSDIQIDNF